MRNEQQLSPPDRRSNGVRQALEMPPDRRTVLRCFRDGMDHTSADVAAVTGLSETVADRHLGSLAQSRYLRRAGQAWEITADGTLALNLQDTAARP